MGLQEKILIWIVKKLLTEIPKEKVKKIADDVLDFVEEKIKGTETKVDDIIGLTLIQECIREPFDIPDNDTK